MKGHPVDVHVGTRIRLQRTMLGMSQSSLAEHADITFQQVQKYENGSNRCSASMLWTFAQALEVVPGYFFDGYHGGKGKPTSNPLAERDTLELAKSYVAIQDRAQRRIVRALASSLARAA